MKRMIIRLLVGLYSETCTHPVSTYLKVRDVFPQKRAHGKFRLSW